MQQIRAVAGVGKADFRSCSTAAKGKALVRACLYTRLRGGYIFVGLEIVPKPAGGARKLYYGPVGRRKRKYGGSFMPALRFDRGGRHCPVKTLPPFCGLGCSGNNLFPHNRGQYIQTGVPGAVDYHINGFMPGMQRQVKNSPMYGEYIFCF